MKRFQPLVSTRGTASTAPRRRRWMATAALATLVPVATTGCNSGGFNMASINPFNKGTAATGPASMTTDPAGPPQTAAAGSTGRLASFGNATKGAFAKTTGFLSGKSGEPTGAVVSTGDASGPLGGNLTGTPANTVVAPDDPLSLQNMPTQVDPKTYVASGQLWESTGNTQKAMESYQRALQADPTHTQALANIARLKYREGDYAAAAKTFQAALKQTPNDAQLYHELGLTLQHLGRDDVAIQVMRRSLQIAPKTSRYANALAKALYKKGDTAAALETLTQNNKPAVAHFNMAYLHREAGNLADARRHLNEAVKFEAAAAGDKVVGQAVSRSRDMLAQINSLPSTANTTATAIANISPPAVNSAPGYPGATAGSVTPAAAAVPATGSPTPTSTSPAAQIADTRVRQMSAARQMPDTNANTAGTAAPGTTHAASAIGAGWPSAGGSPVQTAGGIQMPPIAAETAASTSASTAAPPAGTTSNNDDLPAWLREAINE